MKKQVNTTKVLFSDAYGLLPASEQIKVRDRIMHECGWKSFPTFYAKKDGKVKARKPEISIIEKIFAEYNIHAFEGQFIRQFSTT